MNKISRLLLYKGEQVEKQNMLWNMAGSFVYAFASMVLSFFVMRIAGEDAGGIFALGFSAFGQQMFTLAYFGLRPFQITDQGAKQGGFSFGEYRSFRGMTTAAALLAAIGFSLWMQRSGAYSGQKACAVFLLSVYKIIDGYADVYESEFQRQGSLYLTGKSNTFRTVLSVSVFLFVLSRKKNLLSACIGAAAAQILGVVLFTFSVAGSFSAIDWKIRPNARTRLFSQSSLLFVSVFLDFYIFSAAKYAIDSRMNDAASGYFNLIFMPTSVIYLAANFVIRPFLTRMTSCWNSGSAAEFLQIIKKISLVIGALTVFAVGGTCVFGHFVLSLMELLLGKGYDKSLTPYLSSFVIIVLGGGIYAFANLLYYSLVIMRRQTWIFFVYFWTAGAAALIAPFMVSRKGILGAALTYCILMGILLAGFGFCVMAKIRGILWKGKKKS